MKKKCSKDCFPVCDFCLHFLFYRDNNGGNASSDGTGWCGSKRKEVNAGGGCKNFYCETQWKKNMNIFTRKVIKGRKPKDLNYGTKSQEKGGER